MSSRPPPASPVHPPAVAAAVASTAPMTDTRLGPAGPVALPPPLAAHPFEPVAARQPPPLLPGPAAVVRPPLPPPPPPRHSPPAERWSAAPLSRLLTTYASAPPMPSPSYSPPRFTFSVPPRAEPRAPPPTGAPRRDLPTYASPPHPPFRGPRDRPRDLYGPRRAPPGPLAAPPLPPPPLPPAAATTVLPGLAAAGAPRPAHPAPSWAVAGRDLAPLEPPTEAGPSPYEIRVRQQPLAARACGFGERDRRVIDPPPIVQLVAKAADAADPDRLRYPFNVVHCTLWNEHATVDETALQSQDRKVTRRLMGTLVASPFVGLDERDDEGCFFCFPDLSCRTHGRYRLRFVLMRIDAAGREPGRLTPILTEATSEPFTVFTAKDFPGMRASTELTKALKRQGCAISVKKGNEKANFHAPDDDGGDGGDGGDGDDDERHHDGGGRAKRRRKR
ncbi:MAG: hypothetical protein M1832_000324 [Thelocarpon impressellum]|nr:MAG: hypothetical protein M1832_000324 [Thelocarpon impressellum]